MTLATSIVNEIFLNYRFHFDFVVYQLLSTATSYKSVFTLHALLLPLRLCVKLIVQHVHLPVFSCRDPASFIISIIIIIVGC